MAVSNPRGMRFSSLRLRDVVDAGDCCHQHPVNIDETIAGTARGLYRWKRDGDARTLASSWKQGKGDAFAESTLRSTDAREVEEQIGDLSLRFLPSADDLDFSAPGGSNSLSHTITTARARPPKATSG